MAEKTEDDLLLEIAEQIEMNRVGYREKTDEEKAELIPGIKAIATKKLQEISISFNRVIGHLGDNVPEETRMLILRGISEKVSSDDKVKTIDGAFSVETVTLAENIVVSEKGKAEQQQANSTDVYYSDSGMYENEVVQNDNTNIEDRLSDDSDYGYTNLADMKKDKENVEEILSVLDKEEMEALIELANYGDVQAKTKVMAMMTAMAYTQTTRTFETMSDVEKQNALSALENLAIVAREYDDSKSRTVLQNLVKNIGLEYLLTENKQGELVINEDALFEIFKDYNPEHERGTIQGLEGMSGFCGNLDGYNDFIQESVITNVEKNINSNFTVYINKISDGVIIADDIIPMLDEMFSENYDATLRAINPRAGDTEKNPEVRKLIDIALKKCFEIYIAGTRNENGLIVDDSVKDTMDDMMNRCLERMTSEGKPNKELIDMMLQIDPVKTQTYISQIEKKPEISQVSEQMFEQRDVKENSDIDKQLGRENDVEIRKEHRESIKRDLITMKEEYGLEMALKLGFDFIFAEGISRENAKDWFDVMREQFSFENIEKGKSIIELGDLGVLETHLKNVLKENNEPEKQTKMKQDYITYLNMSMKEIMENNKSKTFLNARNMTAEEIIEAVENKDTKLIRSSYDDGMEPGD